MITSVLLAVVLPICMLLTLYIDTMPFWLTAILMFVGLVSFLFANHKENELVDRVIELENEVKKFKKGGVE